MVRRYDTPWRGRLPPSFLRPSPSYRDLTGEHGPASGLLLTQIPRSGVGGARQVPYAAVMEGPAAGAWRTIRGVALALLCCTAPLVGENAYGVLHRGPHLFALTLAVAAIAVRMAGQQLTFPRVAAVLVVSHVAIHTLLSVTIERRVPGDPWTYRPNVPVPAIVPEGHAEVRIHAANLATILVVAALLYACESNVWIWFRIAALRLLAPVPCLILPPTPDAPVQRPVFELPAFVPRLVPEAPGRRRGPPSPVAA